MRIFLSALALLALVGCVSQKELDERAAQEQVQPPSRYEVERDLENEMHKNWSRQWEEAPEDLTVISRSAQSDVYEQSGIVCMRTWGHGDSIAVACDFSGYVGRELFPSPAPTPTEGY